jgi:hypothetical protein
MNIIDRLLGRANVTQGPETPRKDDPQIKTVRLATGGPSIIVADVVKAVRGLLDESRSLVVRFEPDQSLTVFAEPHGHDNEKLERMRQEMGKGHGKSVLVTGQTLAATIGMHLKGGHDFWIIPLVATNYTFGSKLMGGSMSPEMARLLSEDKLQR